MKKVLRLLVLDIIVFVPFGGLFVFMTTTTRYLISIEVLPAFAYHWFVISGMVLLVYLQFAIISYLDRKELEKENKKIEIEIDASEIKACDWGDILDQCEFKSENGMLRIILKGKNEEEEK